MIKFFKIKILILAGIFAMAGCSDYLDLVPKEIPTLDNAFSNKVNAERFLFTCYARLPNHVNPWSTPALIGGDEIWWCFNNNWEFNGPGTYIAKGFQNADSPYLNYWDGANGASNLYVGIRDCNIFLENIHKPFDLSSFEKRWWSAEAKFLKAYLHFYLATLYGPIPIIRENLPVDATPAEVRMFREPVDDVLNYIVELLDEAIPDLPAENAVPVNDLGRITKPIAAAIKARALVWAASPLFNGGNPEYASFKDSKGRQLISGAFDPAKWQRAATAVKEAIDLAHAGGHKLFREIPVGAFSLNISDSTKLKAVLRYAITEKFNEEIVWPDTRSQNELQSNCVPLFAMGNYNGGHNNFGAPVKIAEQFYTDNGIPIDEDPTWNYSSRYLTKTAGSDHRYYIHEGNSGDRTSYLNFNREPRFHAWLGFDRGVFEGGGKERGPESGYYYLQMRAGEASGMRSKSEHNVCGYQIKKLVNPESAYLSETSRDMNPKRYTYPLVRLSDLYLLYAEALNEVGGPSTEVYLWIDKVRERAGLKGVVESWKASTKPNKPNAKESMREIIKRERLIELCFEGQRFMDLRRWMDAVKYYNEPVLGMNYAGETVEDFNQIITLWDKRFFTNRDYLWPLRTSTVILNSNLEQNPGWKATGGL